MDKLVMKIDPLNINKHKVDWLMTVNKKLLSVSRVLGK